MTKKSKIFQVYGIIVCIVSIITFIICLSVLVSALITRSEPLLSGYDRKDLSSFESFKVETLKSVTKDQAYIPDDETISKMYEAAREEKIGKVLHETRINIIVSGIILLISILLFAFHWTLIKKLNREEELVLPA